MGGLTPLWRMASWLARFLGGALLVLVVFTCINQGGQVFRGLSGPEKAELFVFAVILGGVLVAWWNDLVGAGVLILALSGFFLLEWAASGQLPGGLFPFLWLLPALHLAAAWGRAQDDERPG